MARRYGPPVVSLLSRTHCASMTQSCMSPAGVAADVHQDEGNPGPQTSSVNTDTTTWSMGAGPAPVASICA